MSDFLVQYAFENFWCNPKQDKQGIFKIARLTSQYGVMNSAYILDRRIALPTQNELYHIFQIGQLNPGIIGLMTNSPYWSYDDWTSLSQSINALPLFTQLYNQNGLQVPRYEVFYRFTLTRNLIIAVKENNTMPLNYRTDDFYLRVYSNAYFQMYAGTPALFTAGGFMANTQTILNLQASYSTYTALPGSVFSYCNGYLIDSISLVTVPVGSVAEFIYDASVKRTFTVPMTTVQTFQSTLDNKLKYLLHDSASLDTTINYQDDIEVNIIFPNAGHYTGLFYLRNAPDAYRQVTHRDYSVGVDYATYLQSYLQSQVNLNITDKNQLSFEVRVRHSGYNHALVHESSRIQELYKLNDEKVQQAIVGLNSTNRIWQAASLENSLYTQVMRSPLRALDDVLVQNALGYNAYGKVIADIPSVVYLQSSQNLAGVPLGLQQNYCAYEYDAQGYLLGFTNNLSGGQYVVQNVNSTQVEMIYGQGGNIAPAYFGTTDVLFNTAVNYRVYRSSLTGAGVSDENWQDITGTGYTVNLTGLHWDTPPLGQFIMVRTDERIINYDLNLMPQDGLLYFTFSELQNRDGNEQNYTMHVPMRDIVLFLNGKSLVENIDYVINYPVVTLINTAYLIQPANNTAQTIHVRMSGFCDANLNYTPALETSFIADGAFANSRRYQSIDDSVVRLTAGGRFLTQAQLGVNDDIAGVNVNPAFNGMPYSLSKPLIPIQGLIGTDLLTFAQASERNDAIIQNYLSAYLDPSSNTLQSIPSLYPVLSPFLCKIIYQLINNEAAHPELITATMTDNQVLAFCKPYEEWLPFDPITEQRTIDRRFILIVPINTNTAVQLPLAQYRFILRVIALYAKNPVVSTATYIQLKPLS
jgi:hypothetical protein